MKFWGLALNLMSSAVYHHYCINIPGAVLSSWVGPLVACGSVGLLVFGCEASLLLLLGWAHTCHRDVSSALWYSCAAVYFLFLCFLQQLVNCCVFLLVLEFFSLLSFLQFLFFLSDYFFLSSPSSLSALLLYYTCTQINEWMTIPRGAYREFIIELVFSNQIRIYEYERTTVQSQGFILYEACFFLLSLVSFSALLPSWIWIWFLEVWPSGWLLCDKPLSHWFNSDFNQGFWTVDDNKAE